MIRLISFIILSSGLLFSQDQKAFLEFESGKEWIIQVNDSLTMQTGKVYNLQEGKYHFKARPAISYNWPSILVQDSLKLSAGDTLKYVLSENNSSIEKLSLIEPNVTTKPIVFSDAAVTSQNEKNISVKTTLIVSAIAANWFSFYLKRRADNYYDKYQSASDLSRINNYYNKTEQYDNFSEIMLGISTVALGTYIYLLLSE
ncbi:MAG: hypothetical protein KDF60_11150 [Calditrichaeota bacterium]|nr:hypothetical protein [Calditrichota bacterium]